jgi:hypothetical protein
MLSCVVLASIAACCEREALREYPVETCLIYSSVMRFIVFIPWMLYLRVSGREAPNNVSLKSKTFMLQMAVVTLLFVAESVFVYLTFTTASAAYVLSVREGVADLIVFDVILAISSSP